MQGIFHLTEAFKMEMEYEHVGRMGWDGMGWNRSILPLAGVDLLGAVSEHFWAFVYYKYGLVLISGRSKNMDSKRKETL